MNCAECRKNIDRSPELKKLLGLVGFVRFWRHRVIHLCFDPNCERASTLRIILQMQREKGLDYINHGI